MDCAEPARRVVILVAVDFLLLEVVFFLVAVLFARVVPVAFFVLPRVVPVVVFFAVVFENAAAPDHELIPAQSRLFRIPINVVAARPEVHAITHDGVEGFAHPERAFSAEFAVDRTCTKRFPGVQNLRERLVVKWFHNRVHVIWHDNEGVENISVAVEALQSVRHDFGGFRFAQQA